MGDLGQGEVVGLLLQALEGMGYAGAASALEKEVAEAAVAAGRDGVGGSRGAEAAAGVVAERRRLRGALAGLREVGGMVLLGSCLHMQMTQNLTPTNTRPNQHQRNKRRCSPGSGARWRRRSSRRCPSPCRAPTTRTTRRRR